MKYFATCFVSVLLCGFAMGQAPEGVATVLDLPTNEANPRNSEGDFITLTDGRILFVYTHFTGSASDAGTAHLAGRMSSDGGATWTTEDTLVLANEGAENTMSVSLLRLANGEIALMYLRKNSNADCQPYIRFSTDEAQTWSEPILITDRIGYYVVNNDRLVQLTSGRLVVPAAIHCLDGAEFGYRATAVCYLSDDNGRTWRRSESALEAPADSKTGLQEPAVVELPDTSLIMYCRTDQGSQMRSESKDGGNTWTEVVASNVLSPVAPASIERMPGGNRLVLVWNDHSTIDEALKTRRTPQSLGVSDDGGTTWTRLFDLENDPAGTYCYTAMEWTPDALLLAYMRAGEPYGNGIGTKIVRVPLAAIR